MVLYFLQQGKSFYLNLKYCQLLFIFISERVLMCLELIYWYVMFLEFFTVSAILGPKIEMIKLMVKI